MADHSALIAEFVGITGVDESRAEFYLGSSGWQLQVALSSFFEHHDEDNEDDAAPYPASTFASARPPSKLPEPDATRSVQRPEPPPAAAAAASSSSGPKKAQPAASAKAPGRITTLSSVLRQQQQHSSDSEGEEGQAYYAGGSDESGQQILGPPRKKNEKPDKLVESLFKSAKDRGAEVVDPSEAASSRRKQADANFFGGAGYRLGESENEPSLPVRSASSGASARPKMDCVLRMWKAGFTVDDGPLREYEKPENKEFLSSISNGEVPKELIRLARGGEVSLNMEDHRTEDYVPPKVTIKAFSGHGQMLGSPAPNVVAGPAGPTAAAMSSSPSKSDAGAVKIDETQPTTTLQIRLADGSRLTAKFNVTHTVNDVRGYICSVRPQYATAAFALLTTFPNRELTDGRATLKDANLLNAVIVQKMTA